MSDSDPDGAVQDVEPDHDAPRDEATEPGDQTAKPGDQAIAPADPPTATGDVQASLDDAASSLWSRVFFPRDWLGLVREHVGGVVQVALAVLIPAYAASFLLGEAIDRASESETDRESLIDRLTTIDEWADRLRGIALTVLIIAAVVFAIVWAVDRNRRATA